MFNHPVPRPRIGLAYTASGECITKRNLTQRLQSHHRSHPELWLLDYCVYLLLDSGIRLTGVRSDRMASDPLFEHFES